MNIPEVQFPNPSITIRFDTDSRKAAVRRKTAFAHAAKARYLVALPHMALPRNRPRAEGWLVLQVHSRGLRE